MSQTIDQKVVEMRFDNKNFETNVATSMSTLGKLKQSLNLTGAAKGLEGIDAAAKKCNFSGMGKSIEVVQAKFSALEIAGITAISRLTNSAITAGKNIASALTITPIKTGFQEYETQINAVQTILANTQHEGTNLQQVNAALDELNTYADKTIYNFTEMTRNIGTFTAAGVDLQTSVDSIKGIANLAAVSGSTSSQASTAMYQLSQALAAGKVQLMDWNSVVNAGMGGKVFQDALVRTSELLGTGAEQAIETAGSFRESLTESGWLTTEVLTETLKQFTGAYDEADLIQQGFTESQAKEIAEMAQTAEEVATKVKTFTQLIDTTKEALQSGWSQSWETIVGDFEEAKELWTGASDFLNGVISKSATARNNMLAGWAEGGGRTMAIDAIKNTFSGLLSVLTPIQKAFREVFPAMTSERLLSITEGVRDLTKHFVLGEEQATKLKDTFKGLFSVLDIGKQALTAVLNPIGEFLTGGSAGSIADRLLTATASIGNFFTKLDEGIKTGNGFSVVSDTISSALTGLSGAVSGIASGFGNAGDIFSGAIEIISNGAGKLRDTLGDAFDWIRDNISAGDIFAGLAGGGIFAATKKFSSLVDKIKELFDTFSDGKISSIKENFADVLDGVHETLSSFSEGIKVASLVGIAAAVTMLTSSLKKISEIRADDIAKSLLSIRLMIASLGSGFKSLQKSLSAFNAKGSISGAIAMMGMAKAVGYLADAMVKLKDLSWNEIAKGLTTIGVALFALSKATQAVSKGGVTLRTSVAILALAKACQMLADALVEFGSMDWGEIARGLVAMGGALGEFTAVLSALSKVGGGSALLGAAAVLVASKTLDEISENLERLGAMSWGEIGRGLTAMGGALVELGTASGVLGKLTGLSGLLGSSTLVLAVQSLDEIAESLSSLGGMSWSEIGRGLTAMGGALGEVATASGALGKLTGFSGLLGGGTLVLAVQSLDEIAAALCSIGFLSWGEIRRGLAGMGGALVELGTVSGAVGTFAGLSGLLGAGTLALGVQGLAKLADAFQQFGSMSWDEIGKGLAGMGGALVELGVVSGALGALTGIAGLVGAGTITLAAQGLGEIADAFQKFGSMEWGEIGRGLAAMGGALGEVGIGALLNTFSGLGSMSISTIAEPLGQLADSFQKFGSMDWESVQNGLAAMGAAMGETALGGLINTFSGLGSLSIATIAEPLGTMADSIRKWSDVTVPEGLSTQLSALASGVTAFTLSGLGAGSLAAAAEPLGQLADSVRKWSSVTVPENLSTNLTGLANGVKAFSFAFMGGWSMDTAVEPLGLLADSVRKWSGVSVPENLSTNLTGLANGVKAFSLAFVGGWSMDAIVEPLGQLADSIRKWSGISIPDDLSDNLTKIADGIKSFSAWDSAKLMAIAEPLNTFGTAIKKFSGIQVSGESLLPFVRQISSCCETMAGIDTSGVSSASSAINTLVSTLKKVNGTDVSNVSAFVAAANKLNNIDVSGIKVDTSGLSAAISAITTAGRNMTSGLAKGITSNSSAAKAAITTCLTSVVTAAKGKQSAFQSTGKTLGNKLANGMKTEANKSKSYIRSAMLSAVFAARGYYNSFYSAGKSAGQGLANGLRSQLGAVRAAASELASAAAAASKAALNINSPSKVFMQIGNYVGEGFIKGMNAMIRPVEKSSTALAESTMGSFSKSLSQLGALIASDIDTEPTIRPVVDMSNARASAEEISSLFNTNSSIGITANANAINAMRKNRSNTTNDDVVAAIRDLKGALDSMPSGDTYTFGNVEYGSDSEIADAVQTLVRAARVERRT